MEYIEEDSYWKIVNFDLSDEDYYVDWTQEREWRMPYDLDFNLSEAEILVHSPKGYKKFIKRCREFEDETGEDILMEIKSVITIPSLLF